MWVGSHTDGSDQCAPYRLAACCCCQDATTRTMEVRIPDIRIPAGIPILVRLPIRRLLPSISRTITARMGRSRIPVDSNHRTAARRSSSMVFPVRWTSRIVARRMSRSRARGRSPAPGTEAVDGGVEAGLVNASGAAPRGLSRYGRRDRDGEDPAGRPPHDIPTWCRGGGVHALVDRAGALIVG
jgi:hypothetical protein